MNPAQQTEKRIVRWFLIIVFLLIIGGIATGLSYIPDKPISNYEIRIFGIAFLLLCAILILVIVMIRNAVTANSAFLIRVRDALMSNGKSMKDLEAEYRMHGQRTGENTKATNSLYKELQRLNDIQENGQK